MRIALVAAAGNVHTQKIASALDMHGHQVWVYSLQDHRDSHGVMPKSVEVRYFSRTGKSGYLLSASELRRWIHHDGIDIVNPHYASGYGTLAMIANWHPYALSVWGSDIYQFPSNSLKRFLIAVNLKRADGLLSTSEAMAKRVREIVDSKTVAITPFGVDTSVFTPAKSSGETEPTVRIGIVKTLAQSYGVEYLIRAFARVQAELASIHVELDIYGDGPLRENLERLVVELGLTAVVRFKGRIPHAEVPEVLRTMDVFCAPSLRESFGVAVVEAMASGIPCVTSDADGFLEVMRDGETGIVVPTADVEALTRALVDLASNPKKRARMGRAARRHVVENFEWKENSARFEHALRQVHDEYAHRVR